MRMIAFATLSAASLLSYSSNANAELVQRHSDGSIWTYDGVSKCANDSCPGWAKIDANGATKGVSAGFGGLYQLHSDGQIWRWDGVSHCDGANCFGWAQVDHNDQTKAIAGGRPGFFQLHGDGEIWSYDGHGECTKAVCPGWSQIDRNALTQAIVMGPTLYQMHADHGLWRYDGMGHCSPAGCPGWAQVFASAATAQAVADTLGLFQRLSDGQILKYDGRGVCASPTGPCPGWNVIDRNGATQQIFASGRTLFQMHSDHSLWRYDGAGVCNPSACPGWSKIDNNALTVEAVADSATIYQRHSDGEAWKYDGHGVCDDHGCPGWTKIDKNVAMADIAAFDPGPSPALGDLVAGRPVGGFKVILDSTGAVVFSANPFSSAALCASVLAPKPPKRPLDKLILSKAEEKANATPFKAHSESNVRLGPCTGVVTLLKQGSPDLLLHVGVPGNRLHLRLTTPDVHVIGVSVGLPGGADPTANVGLDVAVQADIRVPLVSGNPLTADNATGSSANTHIIDKNLTTDALKVVSDIVHFFGGPDFLRGLSENQSIQESGVADALTDLNKKLALFPAGTGLVPSYDEGSQTLILRTAK